ncbi:Protein of unknown function [Gryllus bimaculatus]|nr:Protein of unknown function [Gryllus bimaculatus]
MPTPHPGQAPRPVRACVRAWRGGCAPTRLRGPLYARDAVRASHSHSVKFEHAHARRVPRACASCSPSLDPLRDAETHLFRGAWVALAIFIKRFSHQLESSQGRYAPPCVTLPAAVRGSVSLSARAWQGRAGEGRGCGERGQRDPARGGPETDDGGLLAVRVGL